MITDRRRNPRTPALAVLLIAALGAALAPGCAKKPDAPAWDNPFDPSGGGDPFHLRAIMSGNAVLVLWDRPDFPDIATYEILRSLDAVQYELAGETTGALSRYLDEEFAPNHINYYKVRVRNSAGVVSAISLVAAAHVLAPPWLEIDDGAALASTRHVLLTIRTEVGDTLEIAAAADFTGAVRLPAKPGETDLVPWDLGAATANNVKKRVWLRVITGSVASAVASDSVQTMFRPDLQIAGSPVTVASRRQTVAVGGGDGVTQMRFAPSRAGLPAAAWSPPDSLASGKAYFTGDLLGLDPAPQWLYGEFLSDFGYAAIDSLRCVPDDLADARFTLAGGAALTTETVVPLASVAVATQMRFAESPDLSIVPWQAYAGTVEFTLSAGAGLKVVYGEFRNDWFNAVAVDSITFVQTRSPAPR